MQKLDPLYLAQAELLLRCLPEIHKQDCFALKGGTAINLFVRQMPRLSVDIDLAYLPLSERKEALADISDKIESIATGLRKHISGSQVKPVSVTGSAYKLIVILSRIQIAIEANLILRGSVYPSQTAQLCTDAQMLFNLSVKANCLSEADLYGGKICAALDRQHPRDLFDIKILMDASGITPDIRRAFVVYLAGHDRPMSELLDPQLKDIASLHLSQFAGMAREEVTLETLYSTRTNLIKQINDSLDSSERRFLLSVKRCEPDWDILGIPHLKDLPAIQWKLQNIAKMNKAKHKTAYDKLSSILRA